MYLVLRPTRTFAQFIRYPVQKPVREIHLYPEPSPIEVKLLQSISLDNLHSCLRVHCGEALGGMRVSNLDCLGHLSHAHVLSCLLRPDRSCHLEYKAQGPFRSGQHPVMMKISQGV